MYSRITGSDNEKGLVKPVGPYRYHSSGNSIASVQSSGTSGPIGTFTVAHPLQAPEAQPSKDEDFRALLQRHKKTFELLAE